MANIKSQEKRNRQNLKRALRNKSLKSKIKTLAKMDSLKKYGIAKNDTVICNFDTTPAFVLSQLQLKGWTLSNEKGKMNRYEQYQYYINRGAKFLIHFGDRIAVDNDTTKDKLLKQNLVFQYDSIKFYRIDHLKQY